MFFLLSFLKCLELPNRFAAISVAGIALARTLSLSPWFLVYTAAAFIFYFLYLFSPLFYFSEAKCYAGVEKLKERTKNPKHICGNLFFLFLLDLFLPLVFYVCSRLARQYKDMILSIAFYGACNHAHVFFFSLLFSVFFWSNLLSFVNADTNARFYARFPIPKGGNSWRVIWSSYQLQEFRDF